VRDTDLEQTALAGLFGDNHLDALRFIGHQVSTVDAMGHQLMTLAGVMLAITASILPHLALLDGVARGALVAGSAFVFASALVNGFIRVSCGSPEPDRGSARRNGSTRRS
jgi:hypothetical protein